MVLKWQAIQRVCQKSGFVEMIFLFEFKSLINKVLMEWVVKACVEAILFSMLIFEQVLIF